jgi:hypothetical protein
MRGRLGFRVALLATGLGVFTLGVCEARGLVVDQGLDLYNGWYSEVPRSAGGFLVSLSGYGTEVFSADGGLTAETNLRLQGGGTVVPLTATPFRSGYYWLSWETPPEPGQYTVLYQSFDYLNSPEGEERTLPLVIGEDAEPPLDWGTLTTTETCTFRDTPQGGAFDIVVSGQLLPSPAVEKHLGTILSGWSLPGTSQLSLEPPWLPLDREFSASISCNAWSYSEDFPKPTVPEIVVFEAIMAGDPERSVTLQQQLALTCETCDWRTAGAPEDQITQWRQAWDATGSTTGNAGAAGSAPITVTTAEPIGCGIAPSSRNHVSLGWFGLLLVLGGSLRRIRSAGSA